MTFPLELLIYGDTGLLWKRQSKNHIHSSNLTSLAVKWTRIEDVFPTNNGDIPAIAMLVYRRVRGLCTSRLFLLRGYSPKSDIDIIDAPANASPKRLTCEEDY